MNNPKEYGGNRRRQERDNTKCLNENIHKINWKRHDKVIDIGSGDGGFTARILRLFLPGDFKMLVGVDRSSKMVRFANEMYSDDRLHFEVLDIRDNLPEQFVGYFDHVFSFYTLHWVFNQEKAFTNIFNLLSHGGDCLLSILGDIPAYFSVNQIFARSDKWCHWVRDLQNVVSPYHGHPEPELNPREMLIATGFTHVEVKKSKHSYTFQNIDEFKNSVRSVTVFKIPGTMMDGYLSEFVHTAQAEGFLDRQLTIQYDLITVFCKK